MDDEMNRESAGLILRRGREAAGIDLAGIGEITKIPERHLQTMEDGEFAALPARAYAVGFARTYARAVGLDETEIAQMVRDELDGASAEQAGLRPNSFEAGDPARIPSTRYTWVAAGLAVLVLITGFLFWRSFYSPAAELPPIAADEPQSQTAAIAPAAAAGAAHQVIFTATIPDLWVRLYDANGARLLEKSLALGESFEVPAGAVGPQLWTARPEALAITVDGNAVAPLAETQQTMKDVPVDADALLARTSGAAAVPPVEQALAARSSASPAPRATQRKAPAPAPRPRAAEPAAVAEPPPPPAPAPVEPAAETAAQ